MSTASASGSANLSDALGSPAASTSDGNSASVTASPSASGSVSGSRSGSASSSASASGSGRTSQALSQTLTGAPTLGSSSTSLPGSNTLTNAPSLSSGSISHLSDLPTLSGFYSYPPPSVPPTANAPYMQRTSLPENFIFIIVGAVIAFVALLIIAWRVLTSWSINRRFRRHEGTVPTGKASYTPLSDFKQKQQVPSASAHDMKDLGALPRSFSSVPSLFFSPTAEVARHSMRPVSRDPHQHLPAGHYRDASRN